MKQAIYRLGARVLFVGILSTVCASQAWVPPKGEGEVSLIYSNSYTADHLWGDGSSANLGKVRLLGLTQGVDFGLTDRVALSAAWPELAGKYYGPLPHAVPIDGGNYHGGLQDFRFAVRYKLSEKPLVFTPFIGYSHPTFHYEHFAHSAIGVNMWELGLGFNMARRLDPFLSNAYFQTRYTYVITQKINAGTVTIRPNKSRMDGELGYFVKPRLSVRALINAQATHSGLDGPQDFPNPVGTDPLFQHHDQIEATNFVNLGGGATFSVTRSLDVFVTLARTVWGENMHKLNLGTAVGMSWSFRTPWARRLPVMFMQETASWRTKPNEVKTCH